VILCVLTLKIWKIKILNVFKKSSYDYVELEFLNGSIKYGQKTMKFNDFVKQDGPLKKYFEDAYNDYKFAESNATKELHKQLKDKQQGEAYWKQKAEQLEQDLRDEKTKGIVDYMRFEREIGEQQKAKENAQKAKEHAQKALINMKSTVQQVKKQNEMALKLAIKLAQKGKSEMEIISQLAKQGLI
jgi:Ni,Fe-hydrogenase maturation factor